MATTTKSRLDGRFRIIVLILATGCLSMMLANILTLNFTILCMTEDKVHYENFTVDLGIDVFERVDFQTRPKVNTTDVRPDPRTIDYPQMRFPVDMQIPGISSFKPGWNWNTFRLARQNPEIFLRIVKTIMVEAGEIAARRAGENFDPRNIDFSKFREGFNFSDVSPHLAIRVKDYILRRVRYARTNYESFDLQGRNISQWRNVTVDQIELTNITWNGVVNGRIRIVDKPADYKFTPAQKALLFAIVAVGALLTIYIISYCLDRYGCRKTFTVVGSISAISTALCPLAAWLGFVPFVICRCIQGIGFAACFPVIGSITAAWAKLTENGLFNGALTSFIQLAPVFTMPISGILCSIESLDWPYVFYIHAIVTALLMVVWDSPGESNHVSISELREIQSGKVIDGRKRHNRFPIREICTNLSVWAIWIAAVGNMVGKLKFMRHFIIKFQYSIQMLILFSPTYIREILHYAILNVGFAAALPTLFQFAVKMFAGMLSDRIAMHETKKVKIFNTIAFVGMALFLLGLAIVPVEWYVTALVFIILSVTILGFNTGGFFKSATLVGRQYAYFVNTNVQVIMCVAMLTVPFLVYSFTPNNTAREWSHVFIFHAILLIVCNAIFCILGSGLAAPFTNQDNLDGTGLPTPASEQMKPIINNDKAPQPAETTTLTSPANGGEA
ncbi:major facilitator superfamily domain-containing protein [Ditylenchus destructor]|uniref:Major facilitator superfamily domain-containing protein n=1 Tax=Ditylenchus destructor TaxID=166010 RepID=A0AAD4ND71_9BILA|nr:major facilitator superfamily domain-containing protein [Ditylenchus destructor]